ncbi:MAG TPA: hypothetical protein VFH31_01565, partial [Pyrinomonadaceae bacterium]|nr:hypothetical protein [Pyrinomonadaceae bacterium]
EPVAKLIGALVEQGVEVHRLDRELHAAFGPQILQRTNSTSEKIGNYRTIIAHTSGFHEVPTGSYLIFLAQPQRRNVLALFEPQVYPNRLSATGEAERPYDVAGWTLPMQLGVDAPAVMAIQEAVSERRLSLVRDVNEVRQNLALPLRTGDASAIANPLRQPVRVGIYKSSVPNMDEGWTRFIFDTFNVPYETVLDEALRQEGLSSKYDAIILPSRRTNQRTEGNPAVTESPESPGSITAEGILGLKAFVESGGTLVCFDGSCELSIKEFNLPLRNVLTGLRSSDFYCPGSILSLDVDNTQPLARGLPRNVDAYFINSSAFDATDPNVRVIARYAKENVLRSGWLLGEDKLKGRIALAEVSLGKGRIVLFAFRPQHRGQTWGTLTFIWNALSR